MVCVKMREFLVSYVIGNHAIILIYQKLHFILLYAMPGLAS
jgi:hypothetical protein